MASALASLARPVLNVIQGRPILAIFEVTLRCNSACGYCDLPLNQGRYEITREEIRRVGAELYREGLRFLFVQGGEPLLRRDLPEILEDLHDVGFGLTLITNGTKFTRPLVGRLASLPLNLSVSLDTLDRERYRVIRGADQLDDVLAGLNLLKDFPHPKYLTTIVSAANHDEVEAMVRFAKARGFMPVVGAYHWGVERYGKAEAGLQYDRSMLACVFEQVLASGLVPRGYFRQYLRDNVRWLSGGALDRCDAGRYSVAIDASGNVAPCLAQPFAGNLLQQPLSDILARFDRETIAGCSDRSSCNLLCSRVVGSVLRHPVTAAMTPMNVKREGP
jgi:MoaA/NifB/PqqE/SkfB family radical SAM enzyme